MVLFEILEQIISAENLCYFHQLIAIALSHEERFFFEQLNQLQHYH